MKAAKIILAISFAITILAVQLPHDAQAKGGEEEVVNSTVFPAGLTKRQRQRLLLPPPSTGTNRVIRSNSNTKNGSKGFLGIIRSKNGRLRIGF